MTGRTPKLECMRKIEQDRSILKILTVGQHLRKSQFFWKLDVCAISELRMKKQISKSECTKKTEWDSSVLKTLTFWSRSKVHLVKAFSLSLFFFKFIYLFFFFCRQFGPGQVNRLVQLIWTKMSSQVRTMSFVTSWSVLARGKNPTRVSA